MVDTHNRFLQLLVNDDAVGNNDDVAKNILVFRVVQGGKDMRKPCDGVRLAAASRMLDEVVLARSVYLNISHKPFHGTELVVSRKDDRLLDLSSTGLNVLFFLFFYEDKTLDEQDDFLFRPNLLPHI